MKSRQFLFFAVAVVVLTACSALPAQTPNLDPNRKGAPVPVVSFDFLMPGIEPSHYAIAVNSAGNAAYRAEEIPREGATPGDPYIVKFVVSEPTRSRIFELAKQANYFNGSFDYTKTRIANTGVKTLTYTEGDLPNTFTHPTKGQKNTATYNYSENRAIQELTKIFQGIGATLEFGRKLRFDHKYEKLALDGDLKNMQQMLTDGRLEQIHVVAPILNSIINDTSVMHISRQRAMKILTYARQHEQPITTPQNTQPPATGLVRE